MSREKQIEEMAKVIQSVAERHHGIWCKELAKIIYNAGYRKQSESISCGHEKGGEWISNELGGYKYAFYCSECGWVDGYPFNDRHKYCPNCGAKMKGGAE